MPAAAVDPPCFDNITWNTNVHFSLLMKTWIRKPIPEALCMFGP